MHGNQSELQLKHISSTHIRKEHFNDAVVDNQNKCFDREVLFCDGMGPLNVNEFESSNIFCFLAENMKTF